MIFLLIPQLHAAAEEIDDGAYSVNYTVHQGNNDSVSIANDYFAKPATLIVHQGKQYLEFSIKQSEWVKSLEVADADSYVDVKLVNEDHENNMRTVVFALESELSEPILMKMHVHIDSMEPVYDHRYTVRLKLDEDSIERLDEKPAYLEELFGATKERGIPTIIFAVAIVALIALGLRLMRAQKSK